MNVDLLSKISGYLQIAIIIFGLLTPILAYVKFKVDKQIGSFKDLQIKQLDSYSEFYQFSVALRSDSRVALDKLIEIANNKFDVRQPLVQNLLTDFPKEAEHMNLLEYSIDWQQIGVDPNKASLDDFKKLYDLAIPIYQTTIMQTVWKNSQISKKDKILFLLNIIKTTPSIRCLRQACILINEESGLRKNFMDWPQFEVWWNANSNKY